MSELWLAVRWLHLLAMAFFVGGQLFLTVTLQAKLALVVLVSALVVWHIRRPTMHALEAAIFVTSLVIVWLGLSLAHA